MFLSTPRIRKNGLPISSTLFFEEYILNSLPETELFRDSQLFVKENLDRIKPLWSPQEIKKHQTRKEGQLEDNLIRPLLEWLGYSKSGAGDGTSCYVVEPTLRGSGGESFEPDYALFATDEDASKAARYKNQADNQFFRFSISVGDAKAWGIDLDRKSGGRSPAQQILSYLIISDKRFGFITNGRRWRLYRAAIADDIFRPHLYLEVDLERIMVSNESTLRAWHSQRQCTTPFDEQNEVIYWLAYFVVFFGPEAFIGDGPSAYTGKERLEHLYQESVRQRVDIQEDLKDRVYNCLQIVCRGFYNCPHWSGENPPSEENLEDLYSTGLLFLYRMLFLLNAEARGLLSSPKYESMSMYRLAESVVTSHSDNRQQVLVPTYKNWFRVLDTFKVVADKDAARSAGVTHYDGGLFDPTVEGHESLDLWQLDDESLFLLFDSLVYVATDIGTETQRRAIDYSALEIRHLGNIYEGLLEYKLRFADRDLYLVDNRYLEKVPSTRNIEEVIYENQLYLATDKEERKATGTYYTPDHIVDYIVRETLRPICDELELPEDFLGLRILDPAMGSGHFLVAAIEYLAGRIHSLPSARVNLPEESSDDELVIWKRRVARHCIYGVDRNPLAVELAKLSIWLSTLDEGKALSFLDSHLKCGNSLLGTKLSELDTPPLKPTADKWARINYQGDKKLVDQVIDLTKKIAEKDERITSASDNTAADVSRLRKRYEEDVVHPLDSIRVLANLWMSQWFADGKRKREIWKQYDTILQTAVKGQLKSDISERSPRRYFHWELEFSHILLFSEGRGFDVIVGNPPYDVLSTKELGVSVDEQVDFFKGSGFYDIASAGKINLYPLFIVRSLQLLKDTGRFGMIIPLAFLGNKQARGIREWLLNPSGKRNNPQPNWPVVDSFPTEIVAFPQKDDPERRVFKTAKQSTCIVMIAGAGCSQTPVEVYTYPGRDFSDKPMVYDALPQNLALLDKQNLTILHGVNPVGVKLALRIAGLCNLVEINEIATVRQGEFNITNSRREGQTTYEFAKGRPLLLRGAHVARYSLQDAKQGTKQYVVPEVLAKKLEESGKHLKIWDIKKHRIALQESSPMDNYRRLIAVLVEPPSYFGHTINYVTDVLGQDLYAVLAVLNSNLSEWYFRLTSTTNHVTGTEIERLLLPLHVCTDRAMKNKKSFGEMQRIMKAREEAALRMHQQLVHQGPAVVREILQRAVTESDRGKPWPNSIHDALAAIGRRVTELETQWRAEVRQFRSWLDSYLATDSSDWKGESRFRTFHMLDFESFYSICSTNSSDIDRQDWNCPSTHSHLKKQFHETKRRISEVMDESSLLQDIVDETLYDMIGLTPNEVKIIESNSGYRVPTA